MKKRIINSVAAAAVIMTMAVSILGCGTKDTSEHNDDQNVESAEGDKAEDLANVGPFTTQDIYGNEVTEAVFAEYDLTLVNLFATWCGPCVNEMPELAQLQKDMSTQGINVIAVVLDAGAGDEIDENVVETAQELAEGAGVEFPFLIADETYMNRRAEGISAVPESFFVDSEGNIVSEPYVGARNYDKWAKIMEYELGRLEAAE